MRMHKIVTTGCIATLLYTDQNRRAHEARQHDGKTWTHTENLRVFETAPGRHLQFLTVSKTAFDKLMPLKWSLLLCVCARACVCVCVCHTMSVSYCYVL